MPEPGGGAGDAIKKLDTARDNLRDTAKWVVTGTGGIVALIVGGSSFTGLGSFTPGDGRLWLAVACLAAGSLLSWLPFRTALDVIATNVTSLREMVEAPAMSETRSRVDKLLANISPEKYATVEKLSAAFDASAAQRLRRDADEATVREQTELLRGLAPYVNYALALGLTVELRRRFDWMITVISRTAPFIIIFFLAFAWAANPGKDESPLAHPRPASIALRPENAPELARSGLPESCYKPSLAVLLLAEKSKDGFAAVTVPHDTCPALRLDVDAGLTLISIAKQKRLLLSIASASSAMTRSTLSPASRKIYTPIISDDIALVG
jgi:hypothetical protein